MTGYWKTDHGLIHFIGPADSFTHTLPIRSSITKLSWLFCFSRASFADLVKSRLRQWGTWRALHGRHRSEMDPSGSETCLRPSRHVRPMTGASWIHSKTHSYFKQSMNGQAEGITLLQLPILPTIHLTLSCPSPYMCHSWHYSGCEKSWSKSSSVSYVACRNNYKNTI